MRTILDIDFPLELFNTHVRNGTIGDLLAKIMEDIQPEAVYFSEAHGKRRGVLIVNVDSPSDVPRLAEPFFLSFNAECRFRICMLPEDLAAAGLHELAEKWG